MKFILYTGPFCHLCEQAKAVVYQVVPRNMVVAEVNIQEDEALRDKYSTSIPVIVAFDDNEDLLWEKRWPFSAGQIKRLISP